jgi:thioredoxin-dependent peroxiredoxin
MKTTINTPPFGNLAEGKKAPAFTGIDQNGDKISLKEYLGKNVIIYFYPKDNTPTCNTQACNLRDNYSNLLQDGFEVIGISPDAVAIHKKFETKFELPFALIADEDHKIAEKFGVWGTKQFMGKVYDGLHRTTFLIDATGKIKKIIAKPNSKNHTDEILAAWYE